MIVCWNSLFLQQFDAPLLEKIESFGLSQVLYVLLYQLRWYSVQFFDDEHTIDYPQPALHDHIVSTLPRTFWRTGQVLDILLRLHNGIRLQPLQLYLIRLDHRSVNTAEGDLLGDGFVHLGHVGAHNGVIVVVLVQFVLLDEVQLFGLLVEILETTEEVKAVSVEQQRWDAPVYLAFFAEFRAVACDLPYRYQNCIILDLFLELGADVGLSLLLLLLCFLLQTHFPLRFLLLRSLSFGGRRTLAGEGRVEFLVNIEALIDSIFLDLFLCDIGLLLFIKCYLLDVLEIAIIVVV